MSADKDLHAQILRVVEGWGAKDLHAQIKDRGAEDVAAVLGVTPRSLLDLRAGTYPLTVDHLLRAVEAWGTFDLLGTVERIGKHRRAKGRGVPRA